MFGWRGDGPSHIERDHLVRQIKQLLEALVKKIVHEGQPAEQSQEDLQNICAELLGADYDALSRLTVPSMAMLLRTPERIEAFALVMKAEAQQFRAKGDIVPADAIEERVRLLRLVQIKALCG